MTYLCRALKPLLCQIGRWSYLAGGMAITVKGCRAPRREAPILVVAPHSSFLDSVIVYVTHMSTVIVRKESMDNYAGKIINYTQPIYVWRDDPNSRVNTIKEIIDRATSSQDWPQVLIFPEGTTTNRSCLITFKPGAFYPGVPVQPVCIRYPNKLDTVTWTWEGPGALKLLWLTLTQVHSACEIEFLPVYHPNIAEKADPKLFASNVRNVMARALGIPVSDYTYDDCKLMSRAKQINLPYASSIVEVEKLRRILGLDRTNPETRLIKENSIKEDQNSWRMTPEEFAYSLQVSPLDSAITSLFNLFNKNGTGVIDFREYLVCALFIIKSTEPTIELLQLAFKMFDRSGCGHLTLQDFYDTARHTLTWSVEECDAVFQQIDHQHRSYITYDQFRAFIIGHPEYAYVYTSFDDIPTHNHKLD